MRFARIVFRIAGVWGFLVLTPLYFMSERIGAASSAPGAQFYFGFLAVTVAWQVAFFVIASDPVRYRPFMIPAVLEKLIYVVTLLILYVQQRVGMTELSSIVPDAILGALFVMAYRSTREGR